MSLFTEDDFSLNRFELEIEAERNAELMRKYGKLYAIQSANVKDLKRILDYTEVECAEVIRSNASAYGLKDKPSDKVVFALAQNEEAYKQAFKKWLNAFRKEQDYKNAVSTCIQRGSQIKILAELWLNNYYSKPTLTKRNQLKRIKTDDEDIDNEF